MKQIKIVLIALLILLVAFQVVTYKRDQENSGHTPVINSDLDEIKIPCEYKKEDLLQGLTAYDTEDGYLTEKILIRGFSDFSERGVSSLEYAVYDNDGNIATLNRKVVFTDYGPPRIKLLNPFVFRQTKSADEVQSLYLEGWDKLDGDISKHLLITSDNIDYSKPGKYTASVYLKNSFGDEVNMELPVHILNSEIKGYTIELKDPLIYLDKGDDFTPEKYVDAIRSEYTDDIISAKDYKLTITSDVDTSKDGIYEVQFSAASSDKELGGETWMTVLVGDYGG